MKKYLNIKETSDLTQIKQHVIRYWDSKIPGISTKSKGGTRYFDKQNIDKIYNIKKLLYDNGVQNNSLKIVNNYLASKSNNNLKDSSSFHSGYFSSKNSKNIKQILQNMRKLLK